MTPMGKLRLGVNIDHVATLRNARGSAWPDPLRAALLAEAAGADGITAHLREDRRHIRDADMDALRAGTRIPLNFECAATDEMAAIVLRLKPHAVLSLPARPSPINCAVASGAPSASPSTIAACASARPSRRELAISKT